MGSSSTLEALEPAPTTIGLVEFARQAHEEAIEEHEQALEMFASALNSCSCAKGVERRKCTCKNFEKVAAEGGSIFREAMYTCHCDVGRTFSKCDNAHHMRALDLQITTFEALGKLEHAINSAEWMLELAPRLPDGYLRLGNIARRQQKDEYAWKVYTAGIEANEETSLASSPKLQQLYVAREPLNQRLFRQDPLCLPAELVTQIFLLLDFTELPVCLRVCKKWARILTSPLHGTIWRDMIFPNVSTGRAPSVDEIKRILSLAGGGGARKIEIPKDLVFSQPALTLLLKGSPKLEHLEIGMMKGLSLPSNVKIWNRLKHVSIESGPHNFYYAAVDLPGAFPQTFLTNAASSLEHLEFMGIPRQWFIRSPSRLPSLPNLKTLRIGDDYQHPDDIISFPVVPLTMAFPKLEQLWIGPHLPYLDLEPLLGWQYARDTTWPNLKVLVFDAGISTSLDTYAEETRSTLRLMMGLISLQYVSLDFEDWGAWPCNFTGRDDLIPDRNLTPYSEFQNLRVFETRTTCISPEGARTLLSNAIESEQLTQFSIVFPEESSTDSESENEDPSTDNGDTSLLHLKGYEWFRGAPSIHTLECHDFHFPIDIQNDEDHPLPQFLASFPNLRALSIDSSHYEDDDFARLVVSIMEVTQLKTIYMSPIKGRGTYWLNHVARARGVQLVDEPPPLFGYEQWPIPLN
ncbi:uncharacterized protein CPUR_03073 [Claviceps purpurea 20.1]|uniref:F-box domain-containing protein n=1 Tax=Claviceps purpurea (strain 20.1) TaxID=1111077 RepID=M1W4M3_CLAP2|nr:uncharacterized protein CPUR_03073 [Claviceps purpurea 20.1]